MYAKYDAEGQENKLNEATSRRKLTVSKNLTKVPSLSSTWNVLVIAGSRREWNISTTIRFLTSIIETGGQLSAKIQER